MNDDAQPQSALWNYLDIQLRSRGMTTGDLARSIGVHRSRFTAWRREGSLSIPSARAIAKLFGVDLLEVLVASKTITPEEAKPRHRRAPDLTDEELIAELHRRLLSHQSAPPWYL